MADPLTAAELDEIEARDKAIRWAPEPLGPWHSPDDAAPAIRDRRALLAEVRALREDAREAIDCIDEGRAGHYDCRPSCNCVRCRLARRLR